MLKVLCCTRVALIVEKEFSDWLKKTRDLLSRLWQQAKKQSFMIVKDVSFFKHPTKSYKDFTKSAKLNRS